MKNYLCVAVTKEIEEKLIFDTIEQAFEKFEEKYGQEILAEYKQLEDKLKNTISRYEKKLGTLNSEEDPAWDRFSNLKSQKEVELENLHNTMESKCGYYVQKSDEYKTSLVEISKVDMLRICGIYKANGKYNVTEERYACVSAELHVDGVADEKIKKFINKYSANAEALYITQKNEKEKILKFISKTRQQILNNQKKDIRRIVSLK